MPERLATPEHVSLNRRRFLAGMVWAAAGGTAGLGASLQGAETSPYPAERNAKYTLGRPITPEAIATHYNNFAEFSHQKEAIWMMMDKFQIEPWTIKVSGLVRKPQTLDVYQLIHTMPLEERLYRLRCIEAWSIAVPWTGFPFKKLIDLVKPTSDAKYVRMVSFYRPDQAPGQLSFATYPWPHREALTMEEATNELAFLVTGMYGKPLPKQNGAPIRLAVPWKYGFKSIKSIEMIEFTADRPTTFWNQVEPHHHDFFANVDPKVPHPQWSQETERDLATGETRKTIAFNGYGEHVAHMYPKP